LNSKCTLFVDRSGRRYSAARSRQSFLSLQAMNQPLESLRGIAVFDGDAFRKIEGIVLSDRA
jgi:hypothetical protein